MMNSASHRILLVSLLIFLAGIVRAELTSPDHRFFLASSITSDSMQPVRCDTEPASALSPSLEMLFAASIGISSAAPAEVSSDIATAEEPAESVSAASEPAETTAVAEVLLADDFGWQWLLQTLRPVTNVVQCESPTLNELDGGMSLPIPDETVPFFDGQAIAISAR